MEKIRQSKRIEGTGRLRLGEWSTLDRVTGESQSETGA